MPTKPRPTVIKIKDKKVVLNEYYANAKSPVVKYEVFRDRIRAQRDRGREIDWRVLALAIETPSNLYQVYSGSGRALQFKYQGGKFPNLKGVTFPSIKAFLIELGLEHLDTKVKNLRKRKILCVDDAIEIALNGERVNQARRGVIYKITQLSTGKAYVGLTSQPIKHRWNQHICEANKGNQRPLYKAIRRFGRNDFSIEALTEKVQLKKLARIERQIIKDLGTLSPKGFNACAGGQPGNVSVEKISYRDKIFHSQLELGNYIETQTAGKVKSHTAIVRYRLGEDLVAPQRIHCDQPYAGTPLYRIWRAKAQKGLLDPRWGSFLTFYKDMGSPVNYESPKPDLCLTRPNKSLPFGPDNYTWRSKSENAADITARKVRFAGKLYSSYAALSEVTGIAASTLIYWQKNCSDEFESKIVERLRGVQK